MAKEVCDKCGKLADLKLIGDVIIGSARQRWCATCMDERNSAPNQPGQETKVRLLNEG